MPETVQTELQTPEEISSSTSRKRILVGLKHGKREYVEVLDFFCTPSASMGSTRSHQVSVGVAWM